MRRYNEPIEVRIGSQVGDYPTEGAMAGSDLAPARFLWRKRLWRVVGVHARWIESGAWWNGPSVQAARGEEPGSARRINDPAWTVPFGDADAPAWGKPTAPAGGRSRMDAGAVATEVMEPAEAEGDLLCEQEVWRVEASTGQLGGVAVYDLAHTLHSDRWLLRSAVD